MPKLVCLCRGNPNRDASVDAFNLRWAPHQCYAFRPFCLIGRVLSKLQGRCAAISSDCTNLANTDLVPSFTDSVSDETYPPTSHEQSPLSSEQTNSSPYGKEASLCRLDLISQHLRERGVSEQAAHATGLLVLVERDRKAV